MSEPTRDEATEPESESSKHSSEDMAHADVANGERPEQPISPGHSTYERGRANQHPVGDEQAETNRDEESPA
jgi:hypothetical protein